MIRSVAKMWEYQLKSLESATRLASARLMTFLFTRLTLTVGIDR